VHQLLLSKGEQEGQGRGRTSPARRRCWRGSSYVYARMRRRLPGRGAVPHAGTLGCGSIVSPAAIAERALPLFLYFPQRPRGPQTSLVHCRILGFSGWATSVSSRKSNWPPRGTFGTFGGICPFCPVWRCGINLLASWLASWRASLLA
jgi:hypothetical protein